MFQLKDILAKIAVGSMVASLLTFTALMPARADVLQSNNNAGTGVQKEVQEDSLQPAHTDTLDRAAAQITFLGNGKEILVWPRASQRETTTVAQKVVPETAAPAGDEETVTEEETAAPAGDEETVTEEETAAPVEEDEVAVDEGAMVPADEESVQIGIYNKLVKSYDKLLDTYDQLLGVFSTIFTH